MPGPLRNYGSWLFFSRLGLGLGLYRYDRRYVCRPGGLRLGLSEVERQAHAALPKVVGRVRVARDAVEPLASEERHAGVHAQPQAARHGAGALQAEAGFHVPARRKALHPPAGRTVVEPRFCPHGGYAGRYFQPPAALAARAEQRKDVQVELDAVALHRGAALQRAVVQPSMPLAGA